MPLHRPGGFKDAFRLLGLDLAIGQSHFGLDVGEVEVKGKVFDDGVDLIQAFASLHLKPPDLGFRIIDVLEELGLTNRENRLFNGALNILVEKTKGEDFSRPGKILGPKVIVVDRGELQIGISHKNLSIGEVLGNHWPHLLEGWARQRLRPSEAKVDILHQLKVGPHRR